MFIAKQFKKRTKYSMFFNIGMYKYRFVLCLYCSGNITLNERSIRWLKYNSNGNGINKNVYY